MNRYALEKNIVFHCDEHALMDRLHITPEDDVFYSRMLALLRETGGKIRGGFAVMEFPLQELRDNGVVINNLFFQSTVLAKKLHSASHVLVFVATCGRTIGDMARRETDDWDKYIYDQMAYLSLLHVLDVMQQSIRHKFGYREFIRLSPGSLVDWSVGDVSLFSGLMGPQLRELDLHILENGMMDPLQSSSGFLYRTTEDFDACSLCSRERCPTRRTAFDPSLGATLAKESHLL